MNQSRHRLWPAAVTAVALVYLVMMVITGALPRNRQRIEYQAHGVLAIEPGDVTRVTVSAPGSVWTFVRDGKVWIDRSSGQALGDAAAMLERAVKFMHTSAPVRTLRRGDAAAAVLADFGLDDPHLTITLANAGGELLHAAFGHRNADGWLQYMQVEGRDEIYLMSRFVGEEWSSVLEYTRNPIAEKRTATPAASR